TAGKAGDVGLVGVGEAGLDDVDGGGQHHPDPGPEQQQPRNPGPYARVRPDQGEQQDHADGGDQEAGDDQPPLRVAPGQPGGGDGDGEDSDGGRGEHQPGLDRVVLPDFLQVDRDHKEGSLQDQPLDGLRAEPQVGGLVPEQ